MASSLRSMPRPGASGKCRTFLREFDLFGADFSTPGYVAGHGFMDEEVRRAGGELKRGSVGDRAARIVRTNRDMARLDHGGDLLKLAEAAAMTYVRLDEISAAHFQETCRLPTTVRHRRQRWAHDYAASLRAAHPDCRAVQTPRTKEYRSAPTHERCARR